MSVSSRGYRERRRAAFHDELRAIAAREKSDLDAIRDSVHDWSRLSDRVVSIGRFGLGLDGILTWIPGVGDVYGVGAGAFLLVQAVRAEAPPRILAKMGVMLGVDAVVGSIPVAGDAFDFFFRAHARSARVLLEHIDERQSERHLLSGPPLGAGPARPMPAPPPAPPPSPAEPPEPPEPPEPSISETELARRVEALRAEVRAKGGGL